MQPCSHADSYKLWALLLGTSCLACRVCTAPSSRVCTAWPYRASIGGHSVRQRNRLLPAPSTSALCFESWSLVFKHLYIFFSYSLCYIWCDNLGLAICFTVNTWLLKIQCIVISIIYFSLNTPIQCSKIVLPLLGLVWFII